MEMVLAIMGICVAVNFVIILAKYRKRKYLDASIDASLLILIGIVFSGSFAALMVGTVASMFISLYLWIRPITFSSFFEVEGEEEDDEDEEY